MMMCATMVVSSIFGPLLFILGVWTLLMQKDYHKSLDEVKKSTALLHMSGFINLLLGLAVIYSCPHWKMDETFFVTLLGWFLIIRGLCIFFVPGVIHKLFRLKAGWHITFSFIIILWGLILCRIAFSSM